MKKYALATIAAAAALLSMTATSSAMASTSASLNAGTKTYLASAASPAQELVCDEDGDAYCIWSDGYIPLVLHSNVPNLGVYDFRNADQAVENEAEPYAVYVRLYYSPNYKGAWVCINPGVLILNTADYVFNNGSGLPGYHATLYNDVASSSFSTSKCTNPTG